MRQDGTAPVATELFTVEMTLGPTVSGKALKEACGDNDKRQVVDFMYATVSIKEESTQSSSGQRNVPVE